MNSPSTFLVNTPPEKAQEPLIPQSQSNKSPQGLARVLQAWYLIASPPEPKSSASFKERELFRRGRTGSQITIFLYILGFISFPAAFAGSNSLLAAILTIDLFVLTLAVVLNRLKMVSTAGILVVLSFAASPTVNILTTPGGISASTLPIFGLLVLPLMCAVSFLPAWWVFVVAAGNCLFTLYALTSLPSSGELHTVLKVAFPGLVTPILLSQMIVSIVAFLWVRGAGQALQRADRAEEIVALQQRERERQEAELALKQQLQEGIKELLQTHVRAANGDLTARAPLNEDNVLSNVARSLNHLLSRLERYSYTETEMKKAQEAVRMLAERARYAKKNNIPLELPRRTGTVIDEFILEITVPNRQPDQSLVTPLPPSRNHSPYEFSQEKPISTRTWSSSQNRGR